MKNHLFILLILAAIATYSCNSSTEKQTESSNQRTENPDTTQQTGPVIVTVNQVSDSLANENDKNLIIEATKTPNPDYPAHEISKVQADTYIFNFIDNFKSIAVNYSLGCMASKSLLSSFNSMLPSSTDPLRTGLLNYYCYDSTPGANKCFVSLIRYQNYDVSKLPFPTTVDTDYYMANNNFKYTSTETTMQAVANFTSSQQLTVSPTHNKITKAADLTKYGNSFSKLINGARSNSLKTPTAFIHHNQICKVLSQSGCVGLRLYLGFENTAGLENKIRLVIFGVDSNGNNIYRVKQPDGSYKDAVILEKAHP